MDEIVVLYISPFSSRCGACKLTALPDETRHLFSPTEGKTGCGKKFTHVASPYYGEEERVRLLRPDLALFDTGL